jgi:hypothetical protein
VHELTAVSAEARYWLLGFLTGCEPDLAEYLGYRASDNYAYTDEDLVRWHDFLARHRIQGYFPYLNRHPNRALVITDEERAEIRLDDWRPWTYVSERVLVPDGAE